jgi:GT2 family glycosyltransferase
MEWPPSNTLMKVLVGIVSKNRCQILPLAINSALSQKGVSVSVSVYDDQPNDATRDLAAQYPNVYWEFGETTKGYVYARNKMMRETGAEYFCSLDDDSWFTTDDDLRTAVSYLDAHPQVGAIAFDILSPDRPAREPLTEPVETANFIGCGHVLRLSQVREVGYYDPNPAFYGGEEKELSIKLIDKGYQVVRLPGVHVWHDKTTVARDFMRQHRSAVCNDLVFAYRRTPGRILIPALVAKTCGHLRFAARYQKGLLFRSCLGAISDFVGILVTFKLDRKPVSMTTLRKFRRLAQA